MREVHTPDFMQKIYSLGTLLGLSLSMTLKQGAFIKFYLQNKKYIVSILY